MAFRFSKKKIILSTIALILVIGGSAAYLFPKLRIIIPIRMKYSRNASPRMYLVPQQRNIANPTASRSGHDYTSGVMSFTFPAEATRILESEYARAFVFDGGKSVIVSRQREGEGVLQALLGDRPEQAETMRKFWGQENMKSEYAVVNFCLHATPDSGGIFSSQTELMRLPSMLLLKTAYSPLGDVIYQFEAEQFRGFQFGHPGRVQEIYVYLFDSSDQLFRIKLSKLNQSEIDQLLVSITFAPRR